MGFLSKLFGADQVHPIALSTAAQFRELLETSEIPVIVDVWSPTCAPCKKLAPVMVEVATRYDGRVRVAEVNVAAAEPALIGALKTRATPTIIIFEEGEEFGRITGFRPRSWFDGMISTEFPSG